MGSVDAIQAVAKLADGAPMPKAGKRGRWYGFHDLRRGFATMNAGQIDLFELQQLMQHRDLRRRAVTSTLPIA